jgi:hypothetical protein
MAEPTRPPGRWGFFGFRAIDPAWPHFPAREARELRPRRLRSSLGRGMPECQRVIAPTALLSLVAKHLRELIRPLYIVQQLHPLADSARMLLKPLHSQHDDVGPTLALFRIPRRTLMLSERGRAGPRLGANYPVFELRE